MERRSILLCSIGDRDAYPGGYSRMLDTMFIGDDDRRVGPRATCQHLAEHDAGERSQRMPLRTRPGSAGGVPLSQDIASWLAFVHIHPACAVPVQWSVAQLSQAPICPGLSHGRS